MKRISWLIGALALAAAPARAGDLALFGSYWSTDQAGDTFGGGARLGLSFAPWLVLDLRGTYFADVTDDRGNRDLELSAVPLDAGLRLQFGSSGTVPYIGAGATYYLLDSNRGEIDDEFGWYAVAGLALGPPKGVAFFAEAIYRDVEGTVVTEPSDFEGLPDVEFQERVAVPLSGFGANAGIVFRW